MLTAGQAVAAAGEIEMTISEIREIATRTMSELQGQAEKAIAAARKEAAEEARVDERSKWQSRFLTEKVKATAAKTVAEAK